MEGWPTTEIAGRLYRFVRGSDVQRDGMYLEMSNGEDTKVLAEVFYSDVDGSMTFTAYEPDLPLEAVEWMIASARTRLPPESRL